MADWTQAYMLWFRGFVDALGGARPTEDQWRAVLDRLQSYPPAAGVTPPARPVPYNDPIAGTDLAEGYAAAAQQYQQGSTGPEHDPSCNPLFQFKNVGGKSYFEAATGGAQRLWEAARDMTGADVRPKPLGKAS